MVFEESMNNTSLADIKEMQEAVKEAFLPKSERFQDISTMEEVFLPEEVKLQGKIFLAEDRNVFLQSVDVSKNKSLDMIEDADVFYKKYFEADSVEEKFDNEDYSSKFDVVPSVEEFSEEAFLPRFEDPLTSPELAKEVFFPKESDNLLSEDSSFDEKIFFDRNPDIKTFFDEIPSLLDSGRILHAKKIYNQLRSKIVGMSLDKEAFDFLSSSLKRLYSDIRLKYLEAEAIKRLE